MNSKANATNSSTKAVNLGASGASAGASGVVLAANYYNVSGTKSSPSSANSSANSSVSENLAANSANSSLNGVLLAENKANSATSGIILAENGVDSSANSNANGENSAASASSENIVSYELEAVDISAKAEYEEYSSGQAVSREMMEQTSSGNGDIPSILRTLPNVRIQDSTRSSNQAAELDPANISISGGVPQQNSYQVDGLEMNFDVDVSNGGTGGNHRPRGARLQGLNVDASLLDSVVVLDSNIPAQYGRFAGGVVQSNIRKPRTDGWHGDVSFQTTNSSMTRQRLYDNGSFDLDPASGNYQDDFNKFIIRASLEGGITDTLSMLAAFSTARSNFTAPTFTKNTHRILQSGSHYTNNNFSAEHKAIIDANADREQKRRNDNYYIKLFWEPNKDFNLEYSLAYMPSTNTYYSANYINSNRYQIQGGWQTGLKALWSTDLGLWTNHFGYTRLTNLQRGDNPYSSLPLDGPTGPEGNGSAEWLMEGGANDYDTTQDNFTLKSDFVFTPVEAWISTHTFRVGLDLGYQISDFDRLEEGKIYLLSIVSSSQRSYNSAQTDKNAGKPYSFPNVAKNLQTGQTCVPDSFGNMSCGADHYLPILGYFPKNRATVKTLNASVYAEDDINFDLGKGGDINARLGVRFDGVWDKATNSYDTPLRDPEFNALDRNINKAKVAPRFSLQYVAPWQREWESSLTFGANRYYARNLAGYRLQSMIVATRRAAYRCGPNDPWTLTTMAENGNIVCGSNNKDDVSKADSPTASLNSGDVSSTARFAGVDLPYDDELMGAFSQNLGGMFNATLKYIHRDGKKQVMQRLVSVGSSNTAYWVNDGWTKADIITLAVKNIAPIKTGRIDHFYQASLDFTNTRRNFTTYSDTASSVSLDGRAGIKLEDVHQIYKEPLTFKLNTTHILRYGKVNLSWNNLFTARGSYKRIIYYNDTATNNQYKTHKFGGSFNWDTRLGLDAGGLYINVDVLNVLDSKKLVPIGAENGTMLIGVNSQAMILAYEAGRQFWLQMGYKF